MSLREHNCCNSIKKVNKSTITPTTTATPYKNCENNLLSLEVEPLVNNVVSVLGVTLSTNIPLKDYCRTDGYELELKPFDTSKFGREQFKVSYLNETCKVCLKDLIGCAKIPFFDDFGDVNKEIMQISAALQFMDVQITRDTKVPHQICIECYDKFSDMKLFKELCERSKTALDNICDFITKTLDKMTLHEYVRLSDAESASNIQIKEEDLEEDVAFVLAVDQLTWTEETHSGDTTNIDELMSCFRCGASFPNQSSLTFHKTNNLCVNEAFSECTLCGLQPSSIDDLDRHMANSHKLFTLCPKTTSTSWNHRQRSLTCDFCGYVCHTKPTMLLHMKQHIIGEFPCLFCDRRFMTRKRLGMHKRDDHPNELYKCPHCPKEFKLKDTHRNHLMSHNADKPHKCNFCDKQFVLRHHLQNHLRIHTKDRPFLCSFCGKTFRQESGLRDHMSIHDPKLYPARPGLRNKPRRTYAPTKILSCDKCSYTTKQPGNLKKHKTVHLLGGKWEYACHISMEKSQYDKETQHSFDLRPIAIFPSICDKEFRLATSLAKHLPIHDEARDHKCTQCNASFTKPHYLRIHVDGVHLRKRPHKCDQCDAAYLMSNDLRKHKLRRHKAL